MARSLELLLFLIFIFFHSTSATLTIQKVEFDVLDKSALSCIVKITGENPKMADFQVTVKKVLVEVFVS
jgi:hypothetical protein